MQQITHLSPNSEPTGSFSTNLQPIQQPSSDFSQNLQVFSEMNQENSKAETTIYLANSQTKNSQLIGETTNTEKDGHNQWKMGLQNEKLCKELNHTQQNNISTKLPQNSSLQKPKRITDMMTAMQGQIMVKIAAHNRTVNNQLPISASSIDNFTKMLQKQFPNLRIDLIIKSMHTLFHGNCKQQEELDAQSFHSGSGESNYTNTDYSKANSLVRQREAVRIPIQARFTQQKKIAISYLNYGYGVRILRQYINDPKINPTRYNNVITTIMKLAFRRLQDFVKNLGHPVQTINSQDEKVIRAPLTNCQKWLPPDQLETFYKFIKLACNLENKIDIFPGSALKLYRSCIRQLRQRQATQQDYRNQKAASRGGRRMPRVTQNMYQSLANYNQSISGNSHQSSYKANLYPAMNRSTISTQVSSRGIPASFSNKSNQNWVQNKNFQPYRFNDFNASQLTSSNYKWNTEQRSSFG